MGEETVYLELHIPKRGSQVILRPPPLGRYEIAMIGPFVV
jgi:hypothetical protein